MKCRFVYAISVNILGKADRGGLARQRKQTDISQEIYSPAYEVGMQRELFSRCAKGAFAKEATELLHV